MNPIDLNEHDRDRALLEEAKDRTTARLTEMRSSICPCCGEVEQTRSIDISSSQILDEAMDDINDGGDGNPAQFSNDD